MTKLKTDLIQLGLPEEQILENESMARHISFRVGGDADCFVICRNKAELADTLSYLTECEVPHLLVGNGSNLLFSDNGYRGVIVHLDGDFKDARVEGTKVIAGSGKLLSGVSALAAEHGLTGMEFAGGIPGSIGGAVFMNAGAYGGEMKDVVSCVHLMTPDGKKEYVRDGKDMDFAYRHSGIQSTGEIVTQVELSLTSDNPESIHRRMDELTEKRVSKQPVNYPSAGSTFKRPVGGYAAALIEEAGLKGTSVGGAEVSEKHSGFIINKGGATASDVLALMDLVANRVYENSGIRLEPEVRIIPEKEK